MDALTAEAEKVRLMTDDRSKGSNSIHLEPLRTRSDSGTSDRTLLNMSDTEENEKRKSGDRDLEKEGVEGTLPTIEIKDHVTEDPLKRLKLIWWMFVNTVATVMIVSSSWKTKSPALALRRCYQNTVYFAVHVLVITANAYAIVGIL